MRYQSNLQAPDLTSHFRLRHPPLQIAGHDAPSDPDHEPQCTYWTHDECAILCTIAGHPKLKGDWLDIGARLGWTGKHINWMTNAPVTCVDPEFQVRDFWLRFLSNTGFPPAWTCSLASETYFSMVDGREPKPIFHGFVIDGCHDAPEPLKDAQGCARLAADTAVILLHDALGKPVRDAARWLMDNGWKARFYFTPNGVVCAYRGDFRPPDHVRDPAIDWTGHERLVYSEIAKEEWS